MSNSLSEQLFVFPIIMTTLGALLCISGPDG